MTIEGYSPDVYAPLAFVAAENARAKDIDPMLRIPPYKVTHVYRLMDQLQQYTSKQEIELFVNGGKI